MWKRSQIYAAVTMTINSTLIALPPADGCLVAENEVRKDLLRDAVLIPKCFDPLSNGAGDIVVFLLVHISHQNDRARFVILSFLFLSTSSV